MQITAFGYTAKYLVDYAHHGDQLIIEGELRRGDDYEKDGEVVRGQLYVLVNDVIVANNSGNASTNTTTESTPTAPTAPKAPSASPLKKKLFGK